MTIKSIPEALEPLRQLHPTKWWVALSGGLDSVVLLHALVQFAPQQPLVAIHINHGLSPNADQWQSHCQQLCDTLGVELICQPVTVTPEGRGLEDAARQARYRVFAERLQAGDLLLTAHHADDQAETLLLRLLRGSGTRGLAGMARQRPLGAGSLLRPLLGLTRAQLEDYARHHQLQWCDDESNSDTRFDRNYLRQQVMPLLRQRWPEFAARWQMAAEHLAESEQMLSDLAALDLAAAEPRAERVGQSLSLDALGRLDRPRRHNLLRYWCRQLALSAPERVHLAAMEEQLLCGRPDARAVVNWGNVSLRRFQQRLYLLPLAQLPRAGEGTLPLAPGNVQLPGGGQFSLVAEPAKPSKEATPCLRTDLPNLTLRWRRGGERCQPDWRGHSQTLKKLLQEAELEPWLRDALPLIYSDGTLVAAGDLWVCRGFAAEPGQPGYCLQWQPATSFH